MRAFQFIKSKSIWIICILSFLSAFIYNEINLNHLPKDKIRANETVITSDDYSYLNPPEIFIKTGEWKQTGIGKQPYFIRTPGYGMFYYALLKTTGKNKALSYLKIIQLIFFSLSVYCFWFIAKTLINNNTIALIGATMYGCTPFAIGFLYYTLTEGITPALLLFYIYFLIKAYQIITASTKQLFYFFASLLFAYLFITRPVLGIFGLLFPYFLIKDYFRHSIKKLILSGFIYGLISISFITIWQIRNYQITNQFVGLYSIYYPDNNSIYRPTLEQFWEFNKSWGVEGHVYHAYSVPFFLETIKGDTSDVYIKNIINTFPDKYVAFYGEERLTKVFRKYQASILYQKKFYDKRLPMPMETPPIEKEVISDFKQLTIEFKENFWFQYHIITPIKVFKVMAFHSNLSLFIFQKPFRGTILMEITRIVFYGIHSFCFIALLVSLFLFKKNDSLNTLITLITFAYVVFLCYYQRGIEERYTLPILPLLLIGLLSTMKKIQGMLFLRRDSI